MSILEGIRIPKDIQKLSEQEIVELAAECRLKIIKTVSRNGGHLASNLGVVEAILCLAKVFHFEEGEDRIVFDVGHQSYTWKLITGRQDQFASLRQKDGLSGFPKREESSYDYFNTGHSSTAISAALGFSRADRLDGKSKRQNIAFVGDGALSGGMAFEALNDAGQHGDPIIIILNDNRMSIDKNVGGLSKHLERLRVSPSYRKLKKKVKKGLAFSTYFSHLLSDVKARLRLVGRGQSASIFESLGFRYYGPIDGHDVHELLRYYEAAKESKKPLVLHLLTNKGQGYLYAEDAPDAYHGVAPFEVEKGIVKNDAGRKSYTQVAGEILCELAEKDTNICAITAAMTSGTGLQNFAKRFPERFFDTGIAEQNAVTMGAGLAAAGKKVFVALYATFSQRALDQIIHDVCLQNLPLCILIDHAGLVSSDGETHQGIYDLSIFSGLPNLEILAPADEEDLRLSFEYVMKSQKPCMIRYPKEKLPERLNIQGVREINVPRKLSNGSNCTLVAHGCLAHRAVEAARILEKYNITVDVFSCISGNCYQLSDMIESVNKSKKLLLLEDGIIEGGFSLSLVNKLRPSCSIDKLKICAVEDPLAGQATREELLEREGLCAEQIAASVMEMME